MRHYPVSVLNLIKNIARLPGIGEKTAERLAIHILKAPKKEMQQLAQSITDLKEKVRLCSLCFALSDGDFCDICADETRDKTLICVVEQPADMVAVEKSGAFRGVYHVLAGVLSPMDGIGPGDIRIRELYTRIEDGSIREVVLATSTSVEGEATASYLGQHLEKMSVKVTRIASGVPVGGDLKYVDQVTLKRALDTRYRL